MFLLLYFFQTIRSIEIIQIWKSAFSIFIVFEHQLKTLINNQNVIFFDNKIQLM